MPAIPILIKNDVVSGRPVVLMDRLTCGGEYRRIRPYLKEGQLVVVFDIDPSVTGQAWFAELRENYCLRRFTWHVFSFEDRYKAEDQAFDSVESIFTWMFRKGRVPLNALVDLYGQADVEMIFKKELVMNLADYFQVVNCFVRFQEKAGEVLVAPSAAWREIDGWVRACGVSTIPEEKISSANRLGGLWERGKAKADALLQLLGITPWIMTRIRKVRFIRTSSENVQCAVRLYKSDWGLRGEGTHEVDWLLDGRRLHARNTVFVAETPLYQQYEEELDRRGYRWIRQYRQEAFKEVSIHFLFTRLFYRSVRNIIWLFCRCLFAPKDFVKMAALAWLDYLRWQQFIERFRPKYYFAYHDILQGGILRNLVLKTIGCECWYFDHSNSKIQNFCFGNTLTGRQAVRGYLRFDKEVYWGRQLVTLAQEHRSRSASYDAYGSIWTRDIKGSSRVEKILKDRWNGMPPGMTIAAFTTTFRIDAINGEDTHRDFLVTLERLLHREDLANLRIIFKAKSPDFENHLGLEGTDIREVYQRLQDHPRFVVLDPYFSVNTAIYYADFVVTMAFASPTIEALLTRKRAVYYDPGNIYPNSFFERFPQMVAHSEEQLWQLMRHWLNMPDKEFDDYLGQHILTEYGQSQDKPAQEIIREALSC